MPHTPGPWAFTEGKPRKITLRRRHFTVGSLATNRGVAFVFSGIDSDVEPSNAHLIAAAPDLLRACESVMRWFADDNPTHSTIAIVRAAVAKAKGGA